MVSTQVKQHNSFIFHKFILFTKGAVTLSRMNCVCKFLKAYANYRKTSYAHNFQPRLSTTGLYQPMSRVFHNVPLAY